MRSSPARFNIRSSRSEGTRTVKLSSCKTAGCNGVASSGFRTAEAVTSVALACSVTRFSAKRGSGSAEGCSCPSVCCQFSKACRTTSSWASPWFTTSRLTCSGWSRRASRMSSSCWAASCKAGKPMARASPLRLCACRKRLSIWPRRTAGKGADSRSRKPFSSAPRCSLASSQKMSKTGSCMASFRCSARLGRRPARRQVLNLAMASFKPWMR